MGVLHFVSLKMFHLLMWKLNQSLWGRGQGGYARRVNGIQGIWASSPWCLISDSWAFLHYPSKTASAIKCLWVLLKRGKKESWVPSNKMLIKCCRLITDAYHHHPISEDLWHEYLWEGKGIEQLWHPYTMTICKWAVKAFAWDYLAFLDSINWITPKSDNSDSASA